MKILVIGSGGREHAIGWKLAQSAHQPTLYFAPGNPGCESLGQRLEIDVTDINGLALFAEKEAIDLTVVGPEVELPEISLRRDSDRTHVHLALLRTH